jgi:hypothetical protein
MRYKNRIELKDFLFRKKTYFNKRWTFWPLRQGLLWGWFVTTAHFWLHDSFHDCFRIFESCEYFFSATVAFDQREFECTIVSFFVYVCDSTHNWTNNDFRVIMKEVYLKRNQTIYFQILLGHKTLKRNLTTYL